MTRVRTVDIVVAAVVALGLAASGFGLDPKPGDRSFDVLAVLLVVAAGGALALRRRAPLVTLAVTTAAVVSYRLLEYPGGPVYMTVVAAIFFVSVTRGPTKAWLPTAAAVAAVVVVAVGVHDSPGGVVALFTSWAIAALLLGGSVRGRQAERAAMEEEARRRVAEERLRIARDLHDSVAHSLASISVRAGVGVHVLDERPEDARDALRAIKHASGDALAELRSTLGMLRSSDAAAPRHPVTTLDRLSALVESSRAAGLPVEVTVEGEVRPLPPAVDAAAYRIVQESLTNVIRHAGPARATVAVRHGGDGVEIEVLDDGRGVGSPSSNGSGGGHGLAGMRERVTALGGELSAGARRAGGYRVWARFPL